MIRLLIAGASGLLGVNLALAAAEDPDRRYQVVGLVHTHSLSGAPFEIRPVDLNKMDAVNAILDEIRPEVVINCAALTNLDAIETDPLPAWRLNAEFPGLLAKECADRGVRLVHLSTDAVFDGLRGNYAEEDTPQPPNTYAKTKLAGEQAVLAACPQAIVARVNFYGWSISGRRSLAEWFLNSLAAGIQINGYRDVFFCPLLANDLAGLLMKMVEQRLVGLYHVVSRDSMSKYDFGVALARKFNLDEGLIQPGSYRHTGQLALRSPNMILSTARLSTALGISIPDVASGIERFVKLYNQGYPQRLRLLGSE